nr:hypothetical protein Hi04_10k_c2877_00014 [uncultured bacterium]
MTARFVPPSPELVAELRRFAGRRLDADEFNAGVNAPMSDFEREQIDALIDWFTRRYPTPAERLAYIRRAYAQARRRMPPPE